MAEPNIARVLSNPGRFILTPTDLTDTDTYGGTVLGFIGQVAHRRSVSSENFAGEEYGEQYVAMVKILGTDVIAATLYQWDADALAIIEQTATASSEDNVTITYPGTKRSGEEEIANGVLLLYAPNDTRNPALLCFNAVPEVAEAAIIKHALPDRLAVPVVFTLAKGSGGNAWAMDTVSNLNSGGYV